MGADRPGPLWRSDRISNRSPSHLIPSNKTSLGNSPQARNRHFFTCGRRTPRVRCSQRMQTTTEPQGMGMATNYSQAATFHLFRARRSASVTHPEPASHICVTGKCKEVSGTLASRCRPFDNDINTPITRKRRNTEQPGDVMKKNSVSMAIALSLALSTAVAQKTVTGRHGSTASGTVTQKGTTVSGSGTATGAGGNTASAQGSVTKTRIGATETGSVTGPKGGTTTASGTTTNNGNGTATTSGTVTGPKGSSKSGSGTHATPQK